MPLLANFAFEITQRHMLWEYGGTYAPVNYTALQAVFLPVPVDTVRRCGANWYTRDIM